MKNVKKLTLFLAISATAMTAAADNHSHFGPSTGDREFTISGTGSSDADLDSGTFGISGEHGWYLQPNMVWGVRQSVNYASIAGEGLRNDYWNGSTRGYFDYHFLDQNVRPFVGASLGAVYGDGNNNSLFSGLEGGLKYYTLPSTFITTRAEYQWFFSGLDEATNAFSNGAFAYTVGVGYNY